MKKLIVKASYEEGEINWICYCIINSMTNVKIIDKYYIYTASQKIAEILAYATALHLQKHSFNDYEIEKDYEIKKKDLDFDVSDFDVCLQEKIRKAVEIISPFL